MVVAMATLRWVVLLGLPCLTFAGTHGGPPLCTNTCATAHDGNCDDYGNSTCALGTDCADCDEREYALQPNITLCDSPPAPTDKTFYRDAAWRLGNAAFPGAGLKARNYCIPVRCEPYPGCGKDSCKVAPSCLPMAVSDRGYSMSETDEDDYIFSFARPHNDLNTGIFPDARWWGKDTQLDVGGGMCLVDLVPPSGYGFLGDVASQVPWMQRLPKAVFRGDPYSGGSNRFQMDNYIGNVKIVREEFIDFAMHVPNVNANQTEKFQKEEMLKHRCIIYLEGNDCASASYWVLGSGSLVLAPAFLTSHCVFNLRPFVNYIPFKNDYSDLSEVVQKYCVADSVHVPDTLPKPETWEGPSTGSVLSPNKLVPVTYQDPFLGPDNPPWPGYDKDKPPHTLQALAVGSTAGTSAAGLTPSQLVVKILTRAKQDFELICDERREAKLKYEMMKTFMQSVTGRFRPYAS